MSKKKKIFIGVLTLLLLSQFIRIDKMNPPVDESYDFSRVNEVSEEVALLLYNACYDCHSNETNYPWYTNVAPLSWWIKGHINGGRKKLNFSEWGKLKEREKQHLLEEIHEVINENKMPLTSYKLAHPEAKLSDNQKEKILSWITATINIGEDDN